MHESNPESGGRSPLRVLMISLDTTLLGQGAAGDTFQRHESYASRVTSLDIVVLGGTASQMTTFGPLTIWGTGAKGFTGLWRGGLVAKKIIRSQKINLIVTQDPHATGWIGMRCSREFGIPLLVDVHGDFIANPHWQSESWKNRVFAMIQMRILMSARRIRVVSSGIAQKLISAKVPERLIRVINTPINVEIFEHLDERQKVLLEELRFKYADKKLIIFCGRLVAAKNVSFLLEVAAIVRKKREDWMLLIIGDGDLRSQLERQVHRLHLEPYVQFVGEKTQQEVAVYYYAALCLVLPSTNESFGKVIIEAGVAGIPCLATATTGARHIIIDGVTGFISPIGDKEAFADILEEMIEYPDQTKQLGTWAEERYRAVYDPQRTIAGIVALWKETAGV